jgi:hypothetical protein
MRRFSRFFLLALAFGVLAGVCWALLGHGGRSYQGRPERDWILSLAGSPIGQWPTLGPEAVPILARALGVGTGPASGAYRRLWFRFPLWLKRRLAMPRNPVAIRRNAPVVLAALPGDIGAAVPALGRALHDEDDDVRINTAICLKERLTGLGPAKERVLPDLFQAMEDTNNLVRENVTQCLGCYPEDARTVAPVLAQALDDPVPLNRYLAAVLLRRMDSGEAAKGGTARVLLHCLWNSDLSVRITAAAKLAEMKSDPGNEVPELARMLNDSRPAIQRAAARALGNYGRDAASAVPMLRRAMANGEPQVRDAASNALAKIGAPIEVGAIAAGTNLVPE